MARKYSIDLLRILSAAAVLIIHIVSAPVTFGGTSVDANIATTLQLISILMRWSVPVFFMITGYCLLMKQECTYAYCFSHILKFVGILFSVGFFYALLEVVYSSSKIDFSSMGIAFKNVITGNLWDHMWYVYSIIGIYLVMPVIHYYLSASAKGAYTLTTLLFFFTVVFPFFEEQLPIGITLPFGGYLFYVCLGGLIAKYPLPKYVIPICAVFGILSIVWIVVGQNQFSFGYLSPAICFIATAVFLLISRLNIKPNQSIQKLSVCTWGIYLIHPLYINIVIKILKLDLLSSFPYIKLLLFAILIFLLSFFSTSLLRKMPLIKKLL